MDDEVPDNSEYFQSTIIPIVKQINEMCIEKDIPFVMSFEFAPLRTSNTVALSMNACQWMHDLGKVVAGDAIKPQGGTPGTRAWGDIDDF